MKVFRITLLSVVIVSSLTVWGNHSAKALPKLFTLKDVAVALGEAADSFSKLVDSFAHLTKTGIKGYDEINARRTYHRLRDLSAQMSILRAEQQINVVDPIGYYIAYPRGYIWEGVQNNLTCTLENVNNILAIVRAERSEFVLETTYFDMIATFQNRSVVLQELIQMPPPKTAEELEELRKVQKKYQLLIANLERATQELNNYLKMWGLIEPHN
jgi:hypothetical protein